MNHHSSDSDLSKAEVEIVNATPEDKPTADSETTAETSTSDEKAFSLSKGAVGAAVAGNLFFCQDTYNSSLVT
jgi:hypothetical protein